MNQSEYNALREALLKSGTSKKDRKKGYSKIPHFKIISKSEGLNVWQCATCKEEFESLQNGMDHWEQKHGKLRHPISKERKELRRMINEQKSRRI